MAPPAVLDLIRELKASQDQIVQTQEQILQRVDNMEQSQLKLQEDQNDLKSDTLSLINETDKFKHDIAQKFESLSIAVYQPASFRVGRNTKLVKLILRRLPMKTLLLAQRVSRSFKQIIDNSTTLQRQLFFKPAPVKSKALPVMNPLLMFDKHGPRYAHRPTLVFELPSDPWGRRKKVHFGLVEVNDGKGNVNRDDKLFAGTRARVEVATVCGRSGCIHERYEQNCCYTVSWQRMLFTQPGCSIVWLADQNHSTFGVDDVTEICREKWSGMPFREKASSTVEEFIKCVQLRAEKEGKL